MTSYSSDDNTFVIMTKIFVEHDFFLRLLNLLLLVNSEFLVKFRFESKIKKQAK
jgi:hypothetical protein